MFQDYEGAIECLIHGKLWEESLRLVNTIKRFIIVTESHFIVSIPLSKQEIDTKKERFMS